MKILQLALSLGAGGAERIAVSLCNRFAANADNEVILVSILDDSVTEYNGIGCGYGRCKDIYFFSNHQFRKIDVDGDTLLGKWKLKGELLTIRFDRRYKGQKRNNKFIIKYREKDYPTIFMFTKKHFDCYIFCNYR